MNFLQTLVVYCVGHMDFWGVVIGGFFLVSFAINFIRALDRYPKGAVIFCGMMFLAYILAKYVDHGDPTENYVSHPSLTRYSWYSGTTKPSLNLGFAGDLYLNTANDNLYQKSSPGWFLVTQVRDPVGWDGSNNTYTCTL